MIWSKIQYLKKGEEEIVSEYRVFIKLSTFTGWKRNLGQPVLIEVDLDALVWRWIFALEPLGLPGTMSSLSRELVFLILQFLDEEKFKEAVHK